MHINYGHLAQLVRAFGLHPKGRGFEPLSAHSLPASRGFCVMIKYTIREVEMIVCPACHHSNIPALFFCAECSGVLPKPDSLAPEAEADWLKGLRDDNAYGLCETAESLWLMLQPNMFYNNRKRLINGQLLLGRAENVHDYTLLSLDTAGIDHLGVSRIHAALLPMEHGIGVQDLGSTNGTRLNGQAISSGRIYNLTHRDRLEIGKLGLQVHFVKLDVFLKGIREMLVRQFAPETQEVLANIVIPTEALVVLLQRLPNMPKEHYQILTLFQERREPVTLERLHERINRVLGDRGYQGSFSDFEMEGSPTLELGRDLVNDNALTAQLDQMEKTELLIPHATQLLNDLHSEGGIWAEKLRDYLAQADQISDAEQREKVASLVMLLLTQLEEWMRRVDAARA